MTQYTPDEQPTDTRTNEELFNAALTLTEADEEFAWTAITELQHRGTRDVFEQACKLCASPESQERRVGTSILGQLGVLKRTFPAETVTVLLDMLELEQEPRVLESIAIALGHRHDPRAIEPLARLKKHPNDHVRYGVVSGLTGYEDELAIQTLIELSRDTTAYYVRDWATFGLGTQIKSDTSAIREALVACMADEEGIVRGEAMIGLALRHDQRMIEPLLNDLTVGWLGTTLTDEADRIRQTLYPVLVQMSEAWKGDRTTESYKQLEDSIEKCKYNSV